MEAHKITVMLNMSAKEHVRACEGIVGLEPHDTSEFSGLVYNSIIFGRLFIGGGFVFQMTTQQVYDRNMWLMLKDTAGARFHTLLHSQFKSYPYYIPVHYGDISLVLSRDGLNIFSRGSCNIFFVNNVNAWYKLVDWSS